MIQLGLCEWADHPRVASPGQMSVIEWMRLEMRNKEHFCTAAVACDDEVRHLSDYFTRRLLQKSFSKGLSEETYGLRVRSTPLQDSHQICAYHYLQTDLTLLLGASGSKLLTNTWSKHSLSTTERDPAKLRPCLIKLFSVAARIAATKGVGHALKRLLSDFEKCYFPIVEHDVNLHRRNSRRFALLSVLQCGQGSHLLHGILDDPEGLRETVTRAKNSYPSRHVEQDPAVARRQFLFESAYRAKSWSEAYRQARMLKCMAPGSAREQSVNRRLGRVFEGILLTGCPKSKKKQILTDLAGFPGLAVRRKTNFMMEALGSRAEGCRPGDVETEALSLLSPNDPWWRVSLNRLYRHKPVPERWMEDLRTLCQSENTLRGFCRTVLNILRYSESRAHLNLARNGFGESCFDCDRNQVRARLERVRDEVREWQTLLPPPTESHAKSYGASIKLSSEMWKFLAQVCETLGIETPLRAMSKYQSRPVKVGKVGGHSVLNFSPDFFLCGTSEQRFMLARTLFREAAGLNLLEQRAASLDTPERILERALDYAEWYGQERGFLEEFRGKSHSRQIVHQALEETYWATGDQVYRKLAVICHQGGWCPLFDREADLFAASYSDLVSASQGLVKTALWGKQLARVCTNEGLAPLLTAGRECPALCLRLQTLWMAVADQLQTSAAPAKFTDDALVTK